MTSALRTAPTSILIQWLLQCRGGLGFSSRLQRSNNAPLIYLPEVCLPGTGDFDITLSGDDIVATPRAEANVSRLHAELTELMLDLFNLTGKIPEHRSVSPWLVFGPHTDIIGHLQKGRSVSDKFNECLANGERELLTVESFLGSSYLNFRFRNENDSRRVLMPVIDCLNHHTAALTYLNGSYAPGIEAGLMVRNSKPMTDSDECFVRYNKADAMGTFMSYGFVDESAAVMRSIPMDLDLSGGVAIRIFVYTFAEDASWIPPELLDIRYHVPHIKRMGASRLQISHLMIPAEGGSSLRRTMKMLINILLPGIGRKNLKALVLESEATVLERNRLYYMKLKELTGTRLLDGVSEKNMQVVAQLVQGQLKKLSTYSKRRAW